MDKLTIAEINLLRDEAEKERATHRSILKEISSYECIWKENGLDTMPEELQLQILERNRKDEIEPLLDSYAKELYSHLRGSTMKRELSTAFQLKLYEKRATKGNLVYVLLTKCLVCLSLEKILIDSNSSHMFDPKSAEAEGYLVSTLIEKAKKYDDASLFDTIGRYYRLRRFQDSSENLFVEFISSIKTGRDSTFDAAEKLLKDYISSYDYLTESAENTLVSKCNHALIMYYLENSKKGLSYQSSVDLLLKRANKEEIELYFKRYSML